MQNVAKCSRPVYKSGLKDKGELLFIDMNYFAQGGGCALQAAAALKSTVRAQNTIKPQFITRAMHVSEYGLNSMFQV